MVRVLCSTKFMFIVCLHDYLTHVLRARAHLALSICVCVLFSVVCMFRCVVFTMIIRLPMLCSNFMLFINMGLWC